MCYQPQNCKPMEWISEKKGVSLSNLFSKTDFFLRDLRREFNEFEDFPFGFENVREFIMSKKDNSLIKKYNSLLKEHFEKSFGSYLNHAGVYLNEIK